MIEPGKGTSRYRLGVKRQELDLSEIDILETEARGNLAVYKSPDVWFFFDMRSDDLVQLSLFAPFSEKVLGEVGIGDKLIDVHSRFGRCCINHGVHEPINYPGIAFETAGESKSEAAGIVSISVSVPYGFDGDIPEHIKQNISGDRRLP